MILAAIDLGSNSVKITVLEAATTAGPQVLFEDAQITRISEGAETTGALHPQAIERTLAALRVMVGQARDLGAQQIRCVATAGLRGVDNAAVFVERARSEVGLTVEIIDGDQEAELAFAAPASRYGPGPLVVIDPGGRSTEVVTGDGASIHAKVSLPLGGVRLTERFLLDDPPSPRQLRACEAHIDEVLKSAPEAPPGARMVGLSGTVVALYGHHHQRRDIVEVIREAEGQPLSEAAVDDAVLALSRRPAADRVLGTVIGPGRADVIVAGAMIARGVLRRYSMEALTVSNLGVRYGVLTAMSAIAANPRGG